MKSFFAAATIGAVAVSAQQLLAPIVKPLPEVYGQVSPVEVTKTWDERVKTKVRINKPAQYHATRTPENCKFPLEVLILQDTTNSFEDDVKIMRDTQLKKMIDALSASHPGSKFGLADFKDIPIYSLGNRDDYCFKLDLPLSTDLTPVEEAYAKLYVYGGADPAESQYKALIAAAQNTKVGWTMSANEVATKLIVLSTDAPPHYADDGLNAYGLKPYSGYKEGEEEQQCKSEYYPAPEAVKRALLDNKMYLATLVFDPDYMNGLPATSWKWFNEFLGQSPAFVNPLANDASNFWEELSKAIKEIESIECKPTTTAPPPQTTKGMDMTTKGPEPTTKGMDMTTKGGESDECKPCPEGTNCPCVRPEVVIKLAHKPQKLQLIVDNE